MVNEVKTWYQLQITNCPRDEIDVLTDHLEEAGALSITYLDRNDEPILEPEIGTTPVWRENIIQALFDSHEQAQYQLQQLQQHFSWVKGNIEKIVEQDWQRATMDSFPPQQFGPNFWVCPSWSEPPEPEGINVVLDPGLAFGTGTHPTTSLCLNWLAQADLIGKNVIDYGCGSGILAVAALKLGAAHVQAIDLDEQALLATRSNAEINHIPEQKLSIGFPDALKPENQLIIANILLSPLQSLKERFRQLLTHDGTLVVSGLLAEQAEMLIAHYQPHFIIQDTKILGDWALLSFHQF